ncbi:transcriptional regulator [Phreatobacter aquaticus]|uniref:Transcriptional regulator n=1 Tax=Phreatobacter aquaticus TaxID=2570229 RepID=A0A4D7QKC0_9HYPH|nr:ChrR family anti-sigma-E factor [Phreatobacter aquaticus]QCK86139.1 transcriptional regulator [Phreatobacter aquaticus]
MTTVHHVSDELLVAYEAGTLSEGWSLAVATHLALSPQARRARRLATDVGGALLEGIEPEPVTDGAFDRLMARIARTQQDPVAPPRACARDDHNAVPEPLRSYIGGDLQQIPWKRLGVGAWHLPIKTRDGQTSVRLLKIPAGSPVPEHGHRGMELTVVLAGTLCDGPEVFGRGDIEEADEAVEHQPIAGPGGDCVCLAVTDAPLRFKSLIVRLAQPFLRI